MTAAEKEFQEHVGRVIAYSRTRARLSQEKAAEQIGISRPTLSNIENGRQPIRLYDLVLIAGLFGCEPCELIPDAHAPDIPIHTPVEVELTLRRSGSVHCIRHTI